MLHRTEQKAEVGVIIGRFQVSDLHAGHIDLIYSILERHRKVLVLVGSTPGVLVTRNNPLDFATRKLMLKEEFHHKLTILPLQDMPSDYDWSEQVDNKIVETFGDHVSANIYGSRDSFIPHYHGKYETVELQDSNTLSGTDVRKAVSDEVRQHSEFRRGVIYAAFNKHPAILQTVDIAILDNTGKKLVLGRKKTDPLDRWRFPGGFVDPKADTSLEEAAKREATEEVGDLEYQDFKFIGSTLINDWRYRKEVDTLMTAFFLTTSTFGIPTAGDDLAEAKYFNLDELTEDMVCLGHHDILRMLNTHLEKG